MTIPSNLPRVPTTLASQLMLGSLTGTSRSLLDLQIQMASGERVSRPSDDALATSAITVLDDLIERRDQRLRNLSHADSLLNHVDSSIGEASDLLLEAKGVALSQIGVGSDAQTRESQASVIDAMLSELVAISNRQVLDIHLFAGAATARAPVEELLGGLRYVGEGHGMVTDLGLSREITVTAAGEDVFGSLSARVEGERDLDPGVTATTRLVDLDGATGFGIRLGSVAIDVNGTDLVVDLTGADRIQDVVDALESAIQTVDPTTTVQIDPV
ncbi:MAG: flagellin N-terminal helical domain-containing protein, partial [Planctomycetota bacterium]